MKLYEIIYADPPWAYRAWNQKGAGRTAESHYPTMSIQDICNLPIGEIAAPDAVLFLWATPPQLPEAFRVIRAWGFTYKTVAFTWVKLNRKAPTPFWGLGSWTRANSELCLLAVKGSPKRISQSVHQVILSPIQAHSQKPDEARIRIVRLMGDLPRIELFARERRPGWDAWGNEVESDISMGGVASAHSDL